MAGMSMQQQMASQRARRSLRPNPLPTRSVNVFRRRENPLRPNVRSNQPRGAASGRLAGCVGNPRQRNPRVVVGGGTAGWGGWPGFYPWWGGSYSPYAYAAYPYTRAVVAAPVYSRALLASRAVRPHPSVVLASAAAASPWGGWYNPYWRGGYYTGAPVYSSPVVY